MKFKLGEFVLRREFAVGLDNAVMFHAACLKQSNR
jgi:hypothetical protein